MLSIQKSLKVKLLTYFLLLAIVPLCGIGYLAYDLGRRAIIEGVESHLESVAILKEQQLNYWVEHLEHIITILSLNEQLQKYAADLTKLPVNRPEYTAAHDAIVTEFSKIESLGHFSPIFLINITSGAIVASSNVDWEGKFRNEENYFIKGKEHLYLSDVFHSLLTDQPVAVISIPLKDRSGNLTAVLAADINLETLSSIMQERSGLGRTGETYLINKYNLLITNTLFAPNAAFQKWIFSDGAKRALSGTAGSGRFMDYRNVPVIGFYMKTKQMNLALIAKKDESEALASIDRLKYALLWIGFGISVLVCILGIVFSRSITRPIWELVKGTQEIGHGNLEYRIQKTSGDEIGRLSVTFNEMAEKRLKAEEEIKRYSAEIEKANKDLEAFSYSVSHDLRAPLRAIAGFAQILTEDHAGSLDQEGKRVLNVIIANIQKMGQLIDDLLAFSRLDRKDVKMARVSMNKLADEVIDQLHSMIKDRNVQLNVGTLPDTWADRAMLREVMANLLANAFKFTRDRDPAIIEIGGKAEGDESNYYVKDNGVGFNMQYADKLFQVFQRLHSSKQFEGTGVGLALVERIVQKHGGRVRAEAEVNKGATIYFSLPRKEESSG